MELKDKDSSESSKKESTEEYDDWGMMFSRMIRTYHFSMEEMCNLSYPQFKALYMNIYNNKLFNFVIPYLGSSEDAKTNNKTKNEGIDIDESKELNVDEFQNLISLMNSEFNS